MNDELRLTLEGRVKINSGKLLVIDPAYLADFDWQQYERVENALDARFLELLEDEVEIIKTGSDIICLMSELSDEEVVETLPFLSNALHENVMRGKMLKAKRKTLEAMPSLVPPFIAEGADYVLFHNRIGDGYYPVLQDGKRFHIRFNYPLREKGGKMKLDKSRLDGKLVGRSAVDSATQIITDFYNFSIKDSISPELYCCIDVMSGSYACLFVDQNDALIVRKVQ